MSYQLVNMKVCSAFYLQSVCEQYQQQNQGLYRVVKNALHTIGMLETERDTKTVKLTKKLRCYGATANMSGR